ncbi:hypothetical protein [Sulfuracidifex metallicus]|nr:hypothetical protein [Sulfuracidifex metallicus]MCY0850440.1 hypothetical protein [Sulfuracidifex metallicus]
MNRIVEKEEEEYLTKGEDYPSLTDWSSDPATLTPVKVNANYTFYLR